MTVAARHRKVQGQSQVTLNAAVNVTAAADAGQKCVTFQQHGDSETIKEG
jgi:hypothetical protein